jgi:hypothetical protein
MDMHIELSKKKKQEEKIGTTEFKFFRSVVGYTGKTK